jgi:hypothetical protein
VCVIVVIAIYSYIIVRRAKRYSASINPSALRRKAPSGKELQPKVREEVGYKLFMS